MTAGAGRVAATLFARRVRDEWWGAPVHAALLGRPAAAGFAIAPRDPRPADAAEGASVLKGRFAFAGAELDAGTGGDPWDRPSPSRRFAVELHRFTWLPGLLTLGEAGALEALRLWLGWEALFGRRPEPFSWGAEVLERRVFHLACGAGPLRAIASDVETEALAASLSRQARHLLDLDDGPARRAERCAAAALAGAALDGPAGDGLLRRALPRLAEALEAAVPPDGVVRTRAPEQGLELLFDLAALDDALAQRGLSPPEAVPRAADRLGGAIPIFRLGDGALAALNGGGPGAPERLRAVAALSEAEDAYERTPQSGYHRLEGARLRVVIDAGPPPPEGWSVSASAQPLGLALSCGRDRVFGSAGWTPDAAAPAGLRLTAGGSTLVLNGASCGRPLTGASARALGPRLVDGPLRVEARRTDAPGGVWLDLAHDGWVASDGLLHQRRLFLDLEREELRGEDRLTPAADVRAPERARSFAILFHLAPGVDATVARDGRSVLLRTPHEGGWRLRTDAPEAVLEPTVRVEAGVARRGLQVELRGVTTPGGEARVRWKLSAVEPPPRAPRAAAPEAVLDMAPASP